MSLALAVLLSIPVYVTSCLEHPTCEVSAPVLTPAAEPAVEEVETAPPPPAAPAPTPSSQHASSGVEGWRPLVAAYFPASEVDTALRVMACESGGDPTALNPSGAAGLMQVHHPSWGDVYGVTVEDLFDPETNVRIAADIWSKLGWVGQWSCY